MEIDFVRGENAWESKYKERISEEDLRNLKISKKFKNKMIITKVNEGKMDNIQIVPLWKFLLGREM